MSVTVVRWRCLTRDCTGPRRGAECLIVAPSNRVHDCRAGAGGPGEFVDVGQTERDGSDEVALT